MLKSEGVDAKPQMLRLLRRSPNVSLHTHVCFTEILDATPEQEYADMRNYRAVNLCFAELCFCNCPPLPKLVPCLSGLAFCGTRAVNADGTMLVLDRCLPSFGITQTCVCRTVLKHSVNYFRGATED